MILAEGLPVETLLADAEAIAHFDNADDAPTIDPFCAPCAPLVTQGVRVEAVRARLVRTRVAA